MTIKAKPTAVVRALRKLGQDIRDARLRRRITAGILAERAGTGRLTLRRIERGDPSVSMGIYASVLFALGMEGRLADIADSRHDDVGLSLEEERLPQRVRFKASKPKGRKKED